MGPASTGWGRQPSDCRPGTDRELNMRAKLVAVTNVLVQNDCKDELLKLINFVCRHTRCEDIMIDATTTLTRHHQATEHERRQKKARAGVLTCDGIGIEHNEAAATNAADEAMWLPHAETMGPDA